MATHLGSGLAWGHDAFEVGRQAAQEAVRQVGVSDLKLVLVYASTTYDLQQVVLGIRQITGETPLMGCSSAGEFTDHGAISGGVSVALIASDTLHVRLGMGQNFATDLTGAVTHALADFVGNTEHALRAGYLGRTPGWLTKQGNINQRVVFRVEPSSRGVLAHRPIFMIGSFLNLQSLIGGTHGKHTLPL